MRLVVATMRIEEINSARDLLIEAITNNVSTELEKVGLRLINVNIQDVTDESGYIEALGKEASAKAIADAKIKVAQAERDAEIGKAVADKEMTISVASAQADATQGKNHGPAADRAIERRLAHQAGRGRPHRPGGRKRGQGRHRAPDLRRRSSKAQEARAEMQRKQQYAERVVPAEIAKDAAVVQVPGAAQQVTIAAEAEGKRMIVIKQAEAVAAESEAKKILALKQAEGSGIRAVLEGRAEGFRQLVASAGGNASEAVVVLVADQLPAMIDSQMKGISNLKIDKVIVWGGGERRRTKGGISHLLKDLITGLPPVTDLARAAGIESAAYPRPRGNRDLDRGGHADRSARFQDGKVGAAACVARTTCCPGRRRRQEVTSSRRFSDVPSGFLSGPTRSIDLD